MIDHEWAETHGYYHWKCRDCGMSGWTDTRPDCLCPESGQDMEEPEIETAKPESNTGESND